MVYCSNEGRPETGRQVLAALQDGWSWQRPQPEVDGRQETEGPSELGERGKRK